METTNETKVCSCCGRELPITEFRRINTRGGIMRMGICSRCVSEKQREGHQRAKEKREQEKQKTKKANDEKRSLLEMFTPRELMERLAELGYKGELTYTMKIDITDF